MKNIRHITMIKLLQTFTVTSVAATFSAKYLLQKKNTDNLLNNKLFKINSFFVLPLENVTKTISSLNNKILRNDEIKTNCYRIFFLKFAVPKFANFLLVCKQESVHFNI